MFVAMAIWRVVFCSGGYSIQIFLNNVVVGRYLLNIEDLEYHTSLFLQKNRRNKMNLISPTSK